MTHTDPWGKERNTLYKSGRVMMRAREGTGDLNDLVLRMVYEERAYLLGEPIMVHAKIINETGESVTIPYGAGTQAVHFLITGPDGEKVGLRVRQVYDSDGPAPLAIPAGRQFVDTFNLNSYAIVEPGTYHVIAEYKSEGAYYEWDSENKRAVAHPAWEGHLSAEIGEVEIREPSREDDRSALAKLLEGAARHPERERYGMLFFAFPNEEARRMVIEEFPESRYAAYCRFYFADSWLRRGGGWRNYLSAGTAFSPLEGIDREQLPELFQELVLHRLILAHVGVAQGPGPLRRSEGGEGELPVESDPEIFRQLVREFRERFPDSPYELPPEALEVDRFE